MHARWSRGFAKQGVKVQFDTQVINVAFDIAPDHKVAKRIDWIQGGRQGGVDLTEDDCAS